MAPCHDETAIEYAGVWVLKLARRDSRQTADILNTFYKTLQDLVVFPQVRQSGPRLHFCVVASLLRRWDPRTNEVSYSRLL